MNSQVPFYLAFAAGLLSFLSPCVLPLVPGYLSFISGVSTEDMRGAGEGEEQKPNTARVMLSATFFVLGFTLVFVLLGASATFLGKLLLQYADIAAKVGGFVIILFGLHTMGLFKISALYQEKRFQVSSKPVGLLGASLVGIAFAFGWTPCIGPILAAILGIASTQETVWQGIFLLMVYSAGLAIPFLLAALALNKFYSVFNQVKRHFRKIEIVSGFLLIGVGLLIMTNQLAGLANYIPASWNLENLLHTGS